MQPSDGASRTSTGKKHVQPEPNHHYRIAQRGCDPEKFLHRDQDRERQQSDEGRKDVNEQMDQPKLSLLVWR